LSVAAIASDRLGLLGESLSFALCSKITWQHFWHHWLLRPHLRVSELCRQYEEVTLQGITGYWVHHHWPRTGISFVS